MSDEPGGSNDIVSDITDFKVVYLQERGESFGRVYAVYKVSGGPPDPTEGRRELDFTVTHLFLEQLREEMDAGQRIIILDMSPLVFLDSAGMQALIAIRRRTGEERLYVTGMQHSPRRVFKMMGLAAYIRAAESVAEAIAQIAHTASA